MTFPFAKMKQKREELGLTRKELAEKTGLTWRNIESLEQGLKLNPTLETLAALCKGLEVDCGFFFSEDIDLPAPVVGRPKKAATPQTPAPPAKVKRK
ncbi:helix-turn-helix domain-containing protein [Limnoglobus roseus]|uniref:HTH cro/C1-type domain-containing protein n=1 Tax=Limnoglobus roseus TaxID=2598579 RepID=A0A5C1ALY0_9BACT|nr:helix-turn-helix transcriptional regulator [Limnoglobus roseus]QEL20419.1 hypothetical protein PX52LOC_07513 [Limnoglobus roseus]